MTNKPEPKVTWIEIRETEIPAHKSGRQASLKAFVGERHICIMWVTPGSQARFVEAGGDDPSKIPFPQKMLTLEAFIEEAEALKAVLAAAAPRLRELQKWVLDG